MLSVIYEAGSNNVILEELFHKYRYLMYQVANDVLNDGQLAEDIVINVFLKLSASSFDIDDIASSKTRAFMVIITRNAAINQYNKMKKEAGNVIYLDEALNDIPDQGPLPIETVLNKVDIQDVVDTLKKIDDKYSDIIHLKYFYNLTDKEISNMLGITVELVRMRLSRARKMLVKRMVVKE